MSATTFPEIEKLRLQAERAFDAKILELAPEAERPALQARQAAPSAYALGQMTAAFNQGIENFARAFALGQADFRRRTS